WGRNIIRPSGGLFYKELVESLNTWDNTQTFEHVKLSYFGPHAGVDFWRPINYKFGFQLNTRIYMGLAGSTPNGRDYKPSMSYQIGVMGSYRLAPNVMGFLGWAHRQDTATYEST